MLSEKQVIVGVTGGIAAFKAAELVSCLRTEGASVRVVLTRGAQEFVRPLTFKALSGNDVYTDLFGGTDPLPHITLAEKGDILVVYPATANFIGQAAAGLAPDLLTTLLLAFKGPVVICPAMNTKMYTSTVVQANLRLLEERGLVILPPEAGRLACGEVGPGRLPAPETVLEMVRGTLQAKDLKGLTFLVTAGPTREPLDPVRYITNRSSGKMGYAVARAARDRGAQVILISGPTALYQPPGVTFARVNTALEMRKAVAEHFNNADVVVMCAAVSDYRPKEISKEKLKKGAAEITVAFTETPDILAELGKKKRHQLLVGFAAETGELWLHARSKLEAKNLDLVVANDVRKPDAGFEADTNTVCLAFRDGRFLELPTMNKYLVAHHLIDAVLELRGEKTARG
ncbi:MAG: bifunctional phosphopantothenoylcysteine decarboxylase/phosphopantothenate--cysteine ligase CoaBC [Bacillota bacterium]